MQKLLQTNVIAPAFMSELCLPLLERGARKTIVNMSSSVSSLSGDFGPMFPTYAVTKTALNMLVRFLSMRCDCVPGARR